MIDAKLLKQIKSEIKDNLSMFLDDDLPDAESDEACRIMNEYDLSEEETENLIFNWWRY